MELPEDETFDKRDEAEQAAATAALLHLFSDQPLYRLLPPAYRALWLKWAAQFKQAAEQPVTRAPPTQPSPRITTGREPP